MGFYLLGCIFFKSRCKLTTLQVRPKERCWLVFPEVSRAVPRRFPRVPVMSVTGVMALIIQGETTDVAVKPRAALACPRRTNKGKSETQLVRELR